MHPRGHHKGLWVPPLRSLDRLLAVGVVPEDGRYLFDRSMDSAVAPDDLQCQEALIAEENHFEEEGGS